MFPRKHRSTTAIPALGSEGWTCVHAIHRLVGATAWLLALLIVAVVFGCGGGEEEARNRAVSHTAKPAPNAPQFQTGWYCDSLEPKSEVQL